MPGDPDEVRAQAAHYDDVAERIRRQVQTLRAVGRRDVLVGEYADALRERAVETADLLEQAEDRYREVGSALVAYAPELEAAQQDSVLALRAAQDAQHVLDTVTVPTPPEAPADPVDPVALSERQAHERATARATAVRTDASADLATARARLARAVGDRDRASAAAAATVRRAIDDGLGNSWWDDVKDWVDAHADVIKRVTEVLGAIATMAALVALFVPGLNVIVAGVLLGVALTATVGSLVGNSLLAASGNGSWVDVGLDVVALATFGLGRVAVSGMRGVVATSRTTVRTAVVDGARRQQRTVNRTVSRLQRRLQQATGAPALELAGRLRQVRATRGLRPHQAGRQVDAVRGGGPTTLTQRIASGGNESMAELRAELAQLVALSSSPRVAAAAARADRYVRTAQVAGAADVAVTAEPLLSARVRPGAPDVLGWERVKDRFTYEVGGPT